MNFLKALLTLSTVQGRVFEYLMQSLVFFSLFMFSLETLPGQSDRFYEILHIIDFLIFIIFTVEYVLRICFSKISWRYAYTFHGIIDLLVILPFYFSLSIDLRCIRIFRVFKLFHILNMSRYSRAMRRFYIAAKIIKEEVILFSIFSTILLFISASGIYFLEYSHQPEIFSSVYASLWWAIVTLTTVGYGDAYPMTIGGKFFTFFVLIIGVAIVTVPAGLITTALSKARDVERREILKRKIRRNKKMLRERQIHQEKKKKKALPIRRSLFFFKNLRKN